MKIRFEFTEEKKFFNKVKKWISNKVENINRNFKKFINETFLEERFKQYVIQQKKQKEENEILNTKNRFQYLTTYKVGSVNNNLSKKELTEDIKKTTIGQIIWKVEKDDYEKGFIDSRALRIDGINAIAKERGVKLEKFKPKNSKLKQELLNKLNNDAMLTTFNKEFNEKSFNNFLKILNSKNKNLNI